MAPSLLSQASRVRRCHSLPVVDRSAQLLRASSHSIYLLSKLRDSRSSKPCISSKSVVWAHSRTLSLLRPVPAYAQVSPHEAHPCRDSKILMVVTHKLDWRGRDLWSSTTRSAT